MQQDVRGIVITEVRVKKIRVLTGLFEHPFLSRGFACRSNFLNLSRSFCAGQFALNLVFISDLTKSSTLVPSRSIYTSIDGSLHNSATCFQYSTLMVDNLVSSSRLRDGNCRLRMYAAFDSADPNMITNSRPRSFFDDQRGFSACAMFSESKPLTTQ